MNKRTISVCVVTLILVVGLLMPVWAGEVKAREENQQDRINQGVASGELTAKETAHLEKGEANIEAARQQALSDGKVTRKEKTRLNHAENKQSRKIYRAKHNNKKAK